MSRFLALEWTKTEARVAVAASRGDRASVEQAFSVALVPGSSEADLSEVGERIKAALTDRRIGRIDALVAVGRNEVELRQLTLPPCPDDELPGMVRNLAIREFNVLEDDWPLDFLPIDEDPNQPRNVLAAAVNPELAVTVQEACGAAGLKPIRMVLRPCAAASLVRRRHPAGQKQAWLLVDLLEDEADLTVVVRQQVVFVRHARLRADPLTAEAASETLVSEIRRTMVAAQNQLGGLPVESVVLCGTGPEHEALATSLGEQLRTPTELFDPFDGLRLEGPLRRRPPERPGRFAPLLGMLVDELEGKAHAFDFLHPRRRAEPPSRRRTYLLAGVAGAVALLGFLVYGWIEASGLEADIEQLKGKSKQLAKQIERVEKAEKAVAEIGAWKAGDVDWLEKLRWLSDHLGEPKDAMLTQLTLTVTSSNKGVMTLDGQVEDVAVFDRLVDDLWDDSHRTAFKTVGDVKGGGHYALGFKGNVLIDLEKQQ